MKKSKLALLAGVAAASTLFLAACGSSSNSSKGTTYKYVYGTDPDSLNYLTSNRSTTSDITTNLVDGLFENDQYGNLVPALAEERNLVLPINNLANGTYLVKVLVGGKTDTVKLIIHN